MCLEVLNVITTKCVQLQTFFRYFVKFTLLCTSSSHGKVSCWQKCPHMCTTDIESSNFKESFK